MPLDPIRDLITGEVHVSSYQAISGAGYPGVPSLDIYGNVVPFINGEEDKLVEEPGKIMGSLKGGRIRSSPIKVVPNCVRVGVKDGHLVSFSARVEKGTEAEDIIKLLDGKKGLKGLPSAPKRPLVHRKERDRPRPDLDSFSGDPPGMVVTVGRVRVDDGILRAFSLVNNTIRGGAGNAVLIAEQCKKEGYL
jgi:aspartate-semialdehyde dehydrogenase